MSAFRSKESKNPACEDMEPIHGHQNGDLNSDAGEMADAILDWLEHMDAASFSQENAEELNRMLGSLEAMMPAESPAETQASLEQFHQKYASAFASADAAAKSPSETPISHSSKKRFPAAFRRLTAVAAVIAIMLSTMAVAGAFGFDIFDTIARWTDETFHIWIKDVPYARVTAAPLAEGESAAYDSVEAAVEAFGVTEKIVPTWIPERFTLTEVRATNEASGPLLYADYDCENGFLQIRYKAHLDSNASQLEKETSSVFMLSIRGIEHHFLSDVTCRKTFWKNGELEGQIIGTVSIDELREIIKSIY